MVAFAAIARGAHDLWAATLVYLAVAGLAVAYILVSSWGEDAIGFRVPLIIPALVLLSAVSVSFWNAVNAGESFLGLMDWVTAVLVFFLASNVADDDAGLDRLNHVFIAVMAVQLAFAVREYGAAPAPTPEVGGALVNANFASAFHLFWFPVYAGRYLSASRGHPSRPIWMLGALLSFANLALAQSVWAFVCLLLATPFFFRRKEMKFFWDRRRTLVVASAAAAAAVIAIIVYQKFTANTQQSILNRFDWWRSAIAMFEHSPICGIGVGNFPSAYLAFKIGAGENTLFVHGFLFGLLAEMGLFGTLAAIGFFALWCRLAWSAPANRRPYVVGALLFIFYSLASLGPEYLVNLITLALFMGIVCAVVPAPIERPRRSVLIVLAAGAVAAIPFLVSPFLASRHFVDGKEHLAEGRLEEAEKHFSAAIRLDPRAWESYAGLARVDWKHFDQTGEPSLLTRAMMYQQEAIDRNRFSGMLWWERSRMAAALGENSSAVEMLRRAQQYLPHNPMIEKDLEILSEVEHGRV